MKKVKLTESELTRIVRRVINEQNNMVRPTDDKSLFHFLDRYSDLGDEEKRYMARIYKDIQDGEVEKGEGVFHFTKKFPDSVVPAQLLLFLL